MFKKLLLTTLLISAQASYAAFDESKFTYQTYTDETAFRAAVAAIITDTRPSIYDAQAQPGIKQETFDSSAVGFIGGYFPYYKNSRISYLKGTEQKGVIANGKLTDTVNVSGNETFRKILNPDIAYTPYQATKNHGEVSFMVGVGGYFDLTEGGSNQSGLKFAIENRYDSDGNFDYASNSTSFNIASDYQGFFGVVASSGFGAASIKTTGTETYSLNKVIAAVPEPETYAMMLVGLGLVSATVRRKKTA